jgi:flagellar biosynthesis component FlhA
MFEFFEKNWRFLIFVSVVASFVMYSVRKERKDKEKKAQEWKDAQKKTEEIQKDKNQSKDDKKAS